MLVYKGTLTGTRVFKPVYRRDLVSISEVCVLHVRTEKFHIKLSRAHTEVQDEQKNNQTLNVESGNEDNRAGRGKSCIRREIMSVFSEDVGFFKKRQRPVIVGRGGGGG